MKVILGVASELIRHRSVVWSLARRDFRHRYVRNLLGIVWAVIDPIVFVGILYLIFHSASGNTGDDKVPFILYILCGYIAFDLFSGLQHLTQVIKDHEFMVKKMNFKTELLPASRLISGLLLHGIVVGISLIFLLINGILPDIYWIQLIYYAMAMSVFLFATSLLTSSVSLFFPDIGLIIPIANRVLFFLTPVFWKMEILPETTSRWLNLNPLVYIVNGYRDSLLQGRGFWHHPGQTVYFWTFTILMLWLGTSVHRKLRPHFAEVV